MENIVTAILPISETLDYLPSILIRDFGLEQTIAEKIICSGDYRKFKDQLKDDLVILIESPYVDKVYRDSYYHYFSSKLNNIKKDCIRISLFNSEITHEDFENENGIEKIKESYLGFLVFRPTSPHIIGRNVISPKAFKNSEFRRCGVDINTTVNSIKLTVNGFPHTSQDTETITCAESTLWACMEYFGCKYTDYKPILPSQIISTLSRVSFERQLPSKGLDVLQLSSALKEFGFGSKIYSEGEFKSNFNSLLNTYVESGIPIITILQQKEFSGHAVLLIGRKDYFSSKEIEKSKNIAVRTIEVDGRLVETPTNGRGVKIFDLSTINVKLVVIDDNYPPYRITTFDKPCSYYNSESSFQTYEIKHFIVPLYSKVYLDAFEAKNFVCSFLQNEVWGLKSQTGIYLRMYLATSRTYKNWLATQSDIVYDLKERILKTALPKFIWVAELSTKISLQSGHCIGLIIIDATSANISDLKPFIIGAHSGLCISYNQETKRVEPISLDLPSFKYFEKNLIH